ncbi:MAG: glycosyltransferase family 2 protein [Selenomonadaceae bacterium]|nr:glycosyltransferase family 2 protein [Selenomonadaceae bacterium]
MSKQKNKIQKKIAAKNAPPLVAKTAAPAQPVIPANVPLLPAISVIIPMYNSQRYIRSCVESVLNQTFRALEVICVDDCSTDETVKIVAEMAQKDNRIRLIRHAKNSGGASQPRNTGMRMSRGKYIGFLDSDDMYTPTAVAELVSIAEKFQADVVHTEQVYFPENQVIDVTPETKFTTFSKEKGGFCKEPTLETDNLPQRVQMFCQGRLFGWVHNKIYRRDFIMEKNLRFDDLLTSEDIVFYFKVICTAPRIVRVPNIMYIYRHNPNSITRKMVSIEASLHALTHLMIEGAKVMDDFMAQFEFFVKNPAYRQLPLDYIIQQHLIWTQRFYDKYTPVQLDALVRKELYKYCKDFVPFFAYIYGAIHTYRQRLINYDKEIKELKAKLPAPAAQ